MRAVVIGDDRRLQLREVPVPEPGEGQIRVRVAACGICGSDLHMVRSAAMPVGTILGHEVGGTVDAVGGGVDAVGLGDRVCLYPYKPTPGHDLEAVLTTAIGSAAAPGAYAEHVVARADQAWKLPDGMALEDGALVEPLAVGLHGADVGRLEPGMGAVVIGAGPIGVLTAIALRARDVSPLLVVERDEPRRARIADLGFEAIGLDGVHDAVMRRFGGFAPRVFECAGHPSAPNLAIELVGVNGRVVLMGFLEEHVPISQLSLMLKEAELASVWAYRPKDFDEAIALLRSGRIPVERLVTRSAPLEEAQAMFEELASPGTEHVKVLLRP